MTGNDLTRLSERRVVASVREGVISGNHLVFADETSPRLRLAHASAEGIDTFTLESGLSLDRNDVSDYLQLPIGAHAAWMDVQQGLRDISYPTRRIRHLSRTAARLEHLHSVRGDAEMLAQAMQQYDSIRATIPVFSRAESHHYAGTALRSIPRQELQPLIETVCNIVLDEQLMRRWQKRPWTVTRERRDEVLERLRHVARTSSETGEEIPSNYDILGSLVGAEIEELDKAIHERLFSRFKQETDTAPSTDTPDPDDVYVRDEDLPAGVTEDKATVAVLGRRIGNEGLGRQNIEFRKPKANHLLRPLLAWQRQDDGSRRFLFGRQRLQWSASDEAVYYDSSILGAAILAQEFGELIDYNGALAKRLDETRHGRKSGYSRAAGRAGLWPLVAQYRESELLDVAYIRKIEHIIEAI